MDVGARHDAVMMQCTTEHGDDAVMTRCEDDAQHNASNRHSDNSRQRWEEEERRKRKRKRLDRVSSLLARRKAHGSRLIREAHGSRWLCAFAYKARVANEAHGFAIGGQDGLKRTFSLLEAKTVSSE